MKTIGITLKKLREREGLSVRELAEKSGIVYSQISKYENGGSIPSITTLEQLCTSLDVRTSDFLVMAKYELFTDPKGKMVYDAISPLFNKIHNILSGVENTEDQPSLQQPSKDRTVFDEQSQKIRFEK